MPRPRRLPLAWLNLTHSRRRLLTAALGIAFAVVLIHLEIGFLDAMYEAQVALLRRLDADIIICSRAKQAMAINEPFPRRRIYQAEAVAGVESADPLYVEFERPLWKDLAGRTTRPIRVLAFDPDRPLLLLPGIEALAHRLRSPDTVLIDRRSRHVYGRLARGEEVEISRRAIHVVGTFELGVDFVSDGNAIVGDRTFLTLFPAARSPGSGLGRVELGLVRVRPGREPSEVAADLRRLLPDDVVVQTKPELIDREMTFWKKKTPLGYVFGLGAALGFVVGIIICYQILYTEIADLLPMYATLKAIGYPGRFLVAVVMQESLYLAVFGFLPGLLISRALYDLAGEMTDLPMQLTPEKAVLVLLLTLTMCTISGLVALRRVLAADPAEVFR